VSGRGTVVAFTVNRHRWLPGFEPPYVIANVALAEDPTVHLTTNVVGCDPDEVHIGQEVMVRFEPADDVWLPLFEPTGETDTADLVGEPRRPAPRPPASGDRFEHRAVLSGVGRSAIGRRLMVDPLSLTVDACLIAVVVSDASVAADLPKPAVRVEAVGTQITERISWDQETITHEPQVLGQSAHLWTRTDLRPADIDLALVYDGFTFNAIS
jgi:hypothetical protein